MVSKSSWRIACIWSSWTLVPMALLLFAKGSRLGWLYLTAAAAAFGYHWHDQRRFVRVDHGLAWACIAANCWLAWHTASVLATSLGVVGVLCALDSYSAAHRPPPDYGLLPQAAIDHYDRHHTVWHLWCGLAGWCLSWGYTVG